MSGLTRLISQWRQGDAAAEAALFRDVYPILREMASGQLRKSSQWTLRPTELANDVLMALRAGEAESSHTYNNSAQLFALAARMIRCMVVDHIREASAKKRGSEIEWVAFEFAANEAVHEDGRQLDWLALDEALKALEREDARHATLVELRYFLGHSIHEAAAAMAISTATAERMWRYARAFLAAQVNGSAPA